MTDQVRVLNPSTDGRAGAKYATSLAPQINAALSETADAAGACEWWAGFVGGILGFSVCLIGAENTIALTRSVEDELREVETAGKAGQN